MQPEGGLRLRGRCAAGWVLSQGICAPLGLARLGRFHLNTFKGVMLIVYGSSVSQKRGY